MKLTGRACTETMREAEVARFGEGAEAMQAEPELREGLDMLIERDRAVWSYTMMPPPLRLQARGLV